MSKAYNHLENLKHDYGFSGKEMNGINLAIKQSNLDLLKRLEEQAHYQDEYFREAITRERERIEKGE